MESHPRGTRLAVGVATKTMLRFVKSAQWRIGLAGAHATWPITSLDLDPENCRLVINFDVYLVRLALALLCEM